MMNAAQLKSELRNFCGTETWFRHSLFRKYLYTEGVQFLAEQAGCYWLLDKIFACQSCVAKLAEQEFIVWKLILDEEGKGAKLICTDGNYESLYSENILSTDFPLKEITFYFQNNVLLLTSEY
jgi:hypothetical protein